MKKIKVYLQYPWMFPDSPYYKSLVNNPPEEIEYLNIKKQKGVIIKKSIFFFSNFLKKSIRKSTRALNLPLPNAHLTRSNQKYDLIHCAHCLSLNKNMSWVADIESVWQLFVSGKRNEFAKKMIKKTIMRKNCKKILAWTNVTKKDLIKTFPEIKNKVGLVYPAVTLPNIKRKRHKDIVLLFVARYFYQKGGLHALEVIDKLTKKYNGVKGIFVSEVPEEILEKYSQNKKIKFYGLMQQNKLLREVYPLVDIFVYPGYSDSFGFSFLEAMSFGIPIVTVDGFARDEIVENGKTGLILEKFHDINYKVLNHDVINKLVENCSKLIENKKLREKMSKNCIKMMKEGKFSIKERNKKLKRIYEEALK